MPISSAPYKSRSTPVRDSPSSMDCTFFWAKWRGSSQAYHKGFPILPSSTQKITPFSALFSTTYGAPPLPLPPDPLDHSNRSGVEDEMMSAEISLPHNHPTSLPLSASLILLLRGILTGQANKDASGSVIINANIVSLLLSILHIGVCRFGKEDIKPWE